ncbi:bifunctional oligoribonuclease/PAP phosphatase NrnA [candidate division KSB3 bacterium]|uniref:Bifunctional oligoribonuclease/PAP phosphatase NrnA n=1 Tax=candidate division KSB3 bacterium TaxID=2044937 RepID=A0A9D5JXK0_9BACT|nr:bifunctional oligoribonuclease/PAP phosphatase NrnA [candidate division KSB3 bacterium]MBD3325806.1 bifunctional oligoribonuclease/PAP phosphatase NrnA [candidate division KSB3 bacterium]
MSDTEEKLESTNQNSAELQGNQKVKKLKDVLEAHRGETHIIAIQDYPDPDAIAAAFTHQLVCLTYEIEADIVYAGRISHQQNIALAKLLNIEMIRDTESFDFSRYQGSVFVDNQGVTTQLTKKLEAQGIPSIIVVDHHERSSLLTPEFCDIRKIGSTATIYTSYLRYGLLELDKADSAHVRCATALMHGIRSDTNDFIRANESDLQAAAFLSNYYNPNLLSEIVTQSRSKKVMDIIQKALANRVIKDNYSVSGIGYLRQEDRDAIAQAADFLMTEENVHTAIVYGIVLNDKQEELLNGSFRTSKLTLDADTFIKETFGKSENGDYFGGGKQEAAGFSVPVGFLAGTYGNEYEELKWKMFDLQVKQKIFTKIGVSTSTSSE